MNDCVHVEIFIDNSKTLFTTDLLFKEICAKFQKIECLVTFVNGQKTNFKSKTQVNESIHILLNTSHMISHFLKVASPKGCILSILWTTIYTFPYSVVHRISLYSFFPFSPLFSSLPFFNLDHLYDGLFYLFQQQFLIIFYSTLCIIFE